MKHAQHTVMAFSSITLQDKYSAPHSIDQEKEKDVPVHSPEIHFSLLHQDFHDRTPNKERKRVHIFNVFPG
jgi:hypothetical protein